MLTPYCSTLGRRQAACGAHCALANTGWHHGPLTDEVKAAAWALQEQSGDLAIWEQDAPAAQWPLPGMHMPSFLESQAHAGIFPPDGCQGFVSRLRSIGVVQQPWRFDPADVIGLSAGCVAEQVDRLFAGQAAGDVV